MTSLDGLDTSMSVEVSTQMKDQLERIAAQSDLTLDELARAIFCEYIRNERNGLWLPMLLAGGDQHKRSLQKKGDIFCCNKGEIMFNGQVQSIDQPLNVPEWTLHFIDMGSNLE